MLKGKLEKEEKTFNYRHRQPTNAFHVLVS
jgi:hypothetical protein